MTTTSPALYAALAAFKDHYEARSNLIVGSLYANPEAHALWQAADKLQHPQKPTPIAPEADE